MVATVLSDSAAQLQGNKENLSMIFPTEPKSITLLQLEEDYEIVATAIKWQNFIP